MKASKFPNAIALGGVSVLVSAGYLHHAVVEELGAVFILLESGVFEGAVRHFVGMVVESQVDVEPGAFGPCLFQADLRVFGVPAYVLRARIFVQGLESERTLVVPHVGGG